MITTDIKKLVGDLPGTMEFVHLGYIVDDVDKYMPFFKDMFGIEAFDCYDYYTEKTRNEDGPTGPCDVYLALGKTKYGFDVELIQPRNHCYFQGVALQEQGIHLNHTAFRVSDYEAYRDAFFALENCKITMESDCCDDVKGRRRSLFITAEGVPDLIEIQEKAHLPG